MPGRVPSSDGALAGNRNRINITFRWVKQHVSFLSFVLRQGWHAVCQRVRRVHQFLLWGMLSCGVFFEFFGFSSGVLCAYGESKSLLVLPVVYKTWVTSVCLLLGHALWAEVGGGITFVTVWGGTYLKIHKTAYMYLLGICLEIYDGGAIYASVRGTAQSPW